MGSMTFNAAKSGMIPEIHSLDLTVLFKVGSKETSRAEERSREGRISVALLFLHPAESQTFICTQYYHSSQKLAEETVQQLVKEVGWRAVTYDKNLLDETTSNSPWAIKFFMTVGFQMTILIDREYVCVYLCMCIWDRKSEREWEFELILFLVYVHVPYHMGKRKVKITCQGKGVLCSFPHST